MPPTLTIPTAPATPDAWALRACKLPLAFAQVREDPLLDIELASTLPSGATMVMIASGGDTAACLRRLPLKRLYLVDVNPAQLALSRCKWQMAGHENADDSAALLGHLPLSVDQRRRMLAPLLEQLDLNEDALGPFEFVAEHGPDYAGRYEQTFAELRRVLLPHHEALEQVLNSSNPNDAARQTSPETPLGIALDEAFSKVMSQANLVCLFGAEAAQNPLRPFSEHFATRTHMAFGRFSPHSNPFLWQILSGRFPDGHRYDWLQSDTSGRQPSGVEPVWVLGKMNEALDDMPPQSAHLIHLSNILDWLTPTQTEATLRSAFHVLKPGGQVIIRQLNSTLNIPLLESGLVWDLELGANFESRDRSYFYPQIHIGSRV